MTKSLNKPKIPTLRFPEFSGEWEEKKLGEVIALRKEKFDASTGKNRICIELESIEKESGQLITTFESKNLKSIKSIFYEGDVLYGKLRPYLKKYYFADFDGVCSTEIWVMFSKEMSQRYLFYFVQTDIFGNKANQSSGSKMPRAEWNLVRDLELQLPYLPEQQKIAEFLTSIDNWLDTLRTQKEKLEIYKKGLMQKIFSQEIQFKDLNGDDYSEWEEKKLGEVMTLQSRKIKKPKHNYLAIGIRSHFKGTFQKPDSDPDKIAMEELYIVKENDFIVNITFAWEGALAVATNKDEGGLVSHRFPTFVLKSDMLHRGYFQFIFPTSKMKYMLVNISPGGAGRNRVLNKNDFLELKITLPSLPEQKKIADFLLSLDNLIDSKQTQISKAEEWKKGVMRALFI